MFALVIRIYNGTYIRPSFERAYGLVLQLKIGNKWLIRQEMRNRSRGDGYSPKSVIEWANARWHGSDLREQTRNKSPGFWYEPIAQRKNEESKSTNCAKFSRSH